MTAALLLEVLLLQFFSGAKGKLSELQEEISALPPCGSATTTTATDVTLYQHPATVFPAAFSTTSNGTRHEVILPQPGRSAHRSARMEDTYTFRGYTCSRSGTRSGGVTCSTGKICGGHALSSSAPDTHWLSSVENEAYEACEFRRFGPHFHQTPGDLSSGGSNGGDPASSSDTGKIPGGHNNVSNRISSNTLNSPTEPFEYGDRSNIRNWEVSKTAIPVVGFVVNKGAELLRRGILSIDYPVDKLIVVQMGPDRAVSRAIAEIQTMDRFISLRVVKLPNLGCSAGWNRIILEDLMAPYWMILNFDIAFPPGALRLIHQEASEIFRKHPRVGFLNTWFQWGGFKPQFSCFLLRREVVHDIGFFDENIFPVGGEDGEYATRMNGNAERQPWYRQVLPRRRLLEGSKGGRGERREACPAYYVYHGTTETPWSGGSNAVRGIGHGEGSRDRGALDVLCRRDKAEYMTWQRRRHHIAMPAMKWGSGKVASDHCHDPKMPSDLLKGKPQNGSITYLNHPDSFPPLLPWVPFSHPYGHYGLPVWFWVLDPAMRRCILGHRFDTEEGKALPAFRSGNREQGSAEAGCGTTSIPFRLDRVSGLPPRCIDALDICVSSLTSLQDPAKLARLGLIPMPPKPEVYPDCEVAGQKARLPLPPALHSHVVGRTDCGPWGIKRSRGGRSRHALVFNAPPGSGEWPSAGPPAAYT